MIIRNLILTSAAIYSLSSNAAHADMYKWTDDKGDVHYSDSKPKISTTNSRQLQLKPSTISEISPYEINQVITKKPIKNNSGKTSKSIQLEKIMVDITNTTSNRKVVGADYYGDNCQHKNQDLVVTSGRSLLEKMNIDKKVQDIFLAQNYNYIGQREIIFQGQQSESADLILAAIINDIKIRICQQGTTRHIAKVETYLRVEWQLFDPLNRKIIFKAETEGSDNSVYENTADAAGVSGQNTAFTNAITNLLADTKFVQQLDKSDDLQINNSDNYEYLKILSHSALQKSTFVENAEALQDSVVTIRTNTGHGTGFFVSNDGYIITNAHVVHDSQTVIIINKERKFKADVIRKNLQRDVALLKPRESIKVSALSLRNHASKIGETIYVIGTPLDEKLEHTITSGIVSASRKSEEGQAYYQTDAAINPGNSGGPAFSNTGEVMGIAVSALLNKGGSNLSINFLIPIEDALKKLNIGY